jgi:hypothetical protein
MTNVTLTPPKSVDFIAELERRILKRVEDRILDVLYQLCNGVDNDLPTVRMWQGVYLDLRALHDDWIPEEVKKFRVNMLDDDGEE